MVDAPDRPRKGETVTGYAWRPKFGGKGGNQAVAAAKAGAEVRMAGAVGDDEFGRFLLDALDAGGVDASRVARLPDAGSGMSVAISDAERRLRGRDRVGRQPPRRSRRPRRTRPLAGRARADPAERDARRHQRCGRACGEGGRGDGLPQRRALPPLARRARRAGRPARRQRDRGRGAWRPRRDRSRLGGRGGSRRSPSTFLPSSSRPAGKASPGCGGARIPWSFRRSPSRSSAPMARATPSSAPS